MKIIMVVLASVMEMMTLNQTFLMTKITTGGSSSSTSASISTSNFANQSLLPRSRRAHCLNLFRPHEPPHIRHRSSSPLRLRLKSLRFWRKIGVPLIDCETLKMSLHGQAERI